MERMKAIRVQTPGGSEKMEMQEIPIPEPRSDEIRVKVLVCGISFGDVSIRAGKYPFGPSFPLTLGYEAIGVIDKLGSSVERFQIGDKVAVISVSGCAAEYVSTSSKNVYKIPEDPEPGAMCCLILNYMTAYQMLTRCVRMNKGERILVHGISGGVGTAMIQLGKSMGLEVYGTCSTKKCEMVRSMGAIPIDYSKQDFVEFVKGLNPPKVDAVFDPMGGDSFRRSYRCLGRGGRLVGFGAQKKTGTSIFGMLRSLMPLLAIQLTPDNHGKVAFYGLNSVRSSHPEWFEEDLDSLCRMLNEGEISPVIHGRFSFSLSEVRNAMQMVEDAQVIGKVIVDVGTS